jgi:hypothetical protein
MINRDIKNKILKHAKEYPIIALIGPRQSGKTTLVKKIFPKKPYVNMEDAENREFAINDPKGFLAQYSSGAVIDEAQKAPGLFSYLQLAVDEKKKNGMFILTGSQNFLLMENIGQSLAGRVAIFKVLPLSLKEIAAVQKIDSNINKLIFKGSYPRLYDKKMETGAYYANYIQTYVERDVRMIKNIGSLSKFKKFMTLCAARTGQLLNISSLASDCGINIHTASSWLAVLEASFVIFLLRPHHENYSKRVVKMPKLYFYDSGLLCRLLGINSAEQLESHYLRGSIFESFIITDVLKHGYNHGLDLDIYFWRDKLGNEVDLLIETGLSKKIIEVKSGQTIIDDYFKGLQYYKSIAGNSKNDFFVVYGGEQTQHRTGISVLGWKNLADDKNEIYQSLK